DGIRDKLVTGVQTCALPILTKQAHGITEKNRKKQDHRAVQRQKTPYNGKKLQKATSRLGTTKRDGQTQGNRAVTQAGIQKRRTRSEERRVGKECRERGWREQ